MKTVMILAAGLGSRISEITKDIPKPMIEINGKSFIARIIEKIIAYGGFEHIVINLSYKADLLEAHIRALPEFNKIKISFSYEDEPLETGGGIKKALPLIKEDIFFTVNSDLIWHGENPFETLKSKYNENMDLLLLLCPRENVVGGKKEKGDYSLDKHNKIYKTANADYIYMGMQIVNKKLFENSPEGKFSMLLFHNDPSKAIHGALYDGKFYHVSDLLSKKMVEDEYQD